ncbi:MAG: hypothetical protein H0W19_02355 [Nitrosopumilus sp.]|nr:hypothetical protein [Nitrosopumilus sp.]
MTIDNNQRFSSNITSKKVIPYNICAGKNCHGKGIYYLRIMYINKCGWLCETCRNDLELNGLIEFEDHLSNRGHGSVIDNSEDEK